LLASSKVQSSAESPPPKMTNCWPCRSGRAAHAVLDVLILKGLRAFEPDAPRLKRADARGDDDRGGIEARAVEVRI
jgi:hypothetical protein